MPPALRSALSLAAAFAAVLAALAALLMLERDRAGLAITALSVGTTPATLIQRPGSTGPVVVVAHGFAGSRQIMQAYSLHLAHAGYRIVAFDFQGHGRNPVPMSGDVTAIDGTTARLVHETRRVIAAARALPGPAPVALLGHSMATDILVRASLAEDRAGTPVTAIVAISMFSQAVTATAPDRLLIITGQWESYLRRAALDALRLVDAAAGEGDTATAGPVTRRALVAPWVEHVGVLFSPAAVDAATDWLDDSFGPAAPARPAALAGQRGLWLLALFAGIVAAFRPLAVRLPAAPVAPLAPARRFLLATLLPAIAVPLVAAPLYRPFLPVLVADYLMVHLALVGLLQIALLRGWRALAPRAALWPAAALAFWGIAVFGLPLDRHAASFWPTPERLGVIALLCAGTVPFMLGDALVTGAGRAPLWRRVLTRVSIFAGLALAGLVNPGELTFVVIVLPVFLLFILIHGLLGRWVARRSGAAAAGLGLGICLAWALGVSFPLFAQG